MSQGSLGGKLGTLVDGGPGEGPLPGLARQPLTLSLDLPSPLTPKHSLTSLLPRGQGTLWGDPLVDTWERG